MTEIHVSVVYAFPEGQEIVKICCPQGTTIGQAIERSKICNTYPQIDLDAQQVGVYGLKQNLDFQLVDNDRVEIYRPLLLSPTEARRLRAQSRHNK